MKREEEEQQQQAEEEERIEEFRYEQITCMSSMEKTNDMKTVQTVYMLHGFICHHV